MCVDRLSECLASGAEIPEMEAVTVEQASLVRDQVEVRGNAAGRPPPSEHDVQRHSSRGAELAGARGWPLLLPGSYENSGGHRSEWLKGGREPNPGGKVLRDSWSAIGSSSSAGLTSPPRSRRLFPVLAFAA